MSTQTQQGFFVIGDISGFTSYVARTELEHSQEILTELLELIHRHTRHLLRLVKFEGDAVFCYAPVAEVMPGERLMDLVEGTYVAFRNRVAGIRRRTTCTCNACRALPSLDLKFFVHCGGYMNQTIAGINDLVGSDVNLLHRLTKNTITETTGWNAYALFTAVALEQMGIEPRDMYPSVETYEHLGDIQTYSLDLRKRFQELAESRQAVIQPEDAVGSVTIFVDAPPPVVWDWMTDPVKRGVSHPGFKWEGVARPGGRTGPGARNHCAHGKGEITVETVLDWQPHTTYTLENIAKIDKTSWMDNKATYLFEPIEYDQKTRLTVLFQPTHVNLLTKFVFRFIWPIILKRIFQQVESYILASDDVFGSLPEVFRANLG